MNRKLCPRGWAPADGQLVTISSNNALYSVLGTMYGGDGCTTFALPDLRGRSAISVGTGPGLSSYVQGERGGTENFTVFVSELPSHSHTVSAAAVAGDQRGPAGDLLADPPNIRGEQIYPYHDADAGEPIVAMDPRMISCTGGGLPVFKVSPYLTMIYCVAMTGVFPPRS